MALSNEEVRNTIYKLYLENGIFTVKELRELGFSRKNIDYAKKNYIAHSDCKRGFYFFYDYDGLFNYGIDLLNDSKKEQASIVFKKFEELFIWYVCYSNFDYDSYQAQKIYNKFINAINDNNKEYFKDYMKTLNFYLMLMTMNHNDFLLNKLEDIINNLKLEDIIFDREDDDKKFDNDLRMLVFNKKYNDAYLMVEPYNDVNHFKYKVVKQKLMYVKESELVLLNGRLLKHE